MIEEYLLTVIQALGLIAVAAGIAGLYWPMSVAGAFLIAATELISRRRTVARKNEEDDG